MVPNARDAQRSVIGPKAVKLADTSSCEPASEGGMVGQRVAASEPGHSS